jgi:regulator of protease activity HflC (stomatin/prohibitin superfamily)
MILEIGTGTIILIVVLAIILLLAIIVASTCIKVVQQSQELVVERLGKYSRTVSSGVHWLVPFFDKVACRVSLKEQVADFEPQSVITKDNVSILVDTVAFFRITDSKKFAYGVSRPIEAINKLTMTTLRQIIGNLTLDETLTSRDYINSKIQEPVDLATDAWGIKIVRLELKNIEPPLDIKAAMEKQMKAEREKRQAILLAEGEKQAMITRAQGQRDSAISEAEGKKQARILEAEAQKEATILAAEAEAARIAKAAEAEAAAIKAIKDAGADDRVIQIKSLEALGRLADGQATKIVVPSNLQDLTGIVSAVETIKSTKESK